MSRIIRALVLVAALATVGHLQPLDSELSSDKGFFGRFAREVSSYDPVDKVIGLLEEGGKISKEALTTMKNHFKKLNEILKMTDINIEQLQTELYQIRESNITSEYLDNYWQGKEELQLARSDIRKLAFRTTAAVRDIKILLQQWDDKETSFIEAELQMLKSLMKEILRTLKDAKEKYNNAIKSMKATSNQLTATNNTLSAMLDEQSEEYSEWTNTVRTGAYGGATVVTAAICLPVDATVAGGNIFLLL